MVGAVPGQVDALAADLQAAVLGEGLLVRGPGRVIVAQQQRRVSSCPMRVTWLPNSADAPT
jgi:hypothetical protein